MWPGSQQSLRADSRECGGKGRPILGTIAMLNTNLPLLFIQQIMDALTVLGFPQCIRAVGSKGKQPLISKVVSQYSQCSCLPKDAEQTCPITPYPIQALLPGLSIWKCQFPMHDPSTQSVELPSSQMNHMHGLNPTVIHLLEQPLMIHQMARGGSCGPSTSQCLPGGWDGPPYLPDAPQDLKYPAIQLVQME